MTTLKRTYLSSMNYETKTFKIEIGEGTYDFGFRGVQVYLVRNKETNVIEAETQILSNALEGILFLQESTDAAKAVFEQSRVTPPDLGLVH